MRWQRVADASGVEQWELAGFTADGFDATSFRVSWMIYRVRGRRTRTNPSGEYFRAMRDGVVLRANQRVRSWLSRHAAMGAVEEIARLGLGA
jgi:hypothetical protein